MAWAQLHNNYSHLESGVAWRIAGKTRYDVFIQAMMPSASFSSVSRVAGVAGAQIVVPFVSTTDGGDGCDSLWIPGEGGPRWVSGRQSGETWE